jgi:RNAse (barnase) inhibitor barstar
MKRIIVMLLIACSAVTTISADSSAAPQKKPETVIFTLNAIIQKFGQNEGQVYSVNRNPNTNIIESSIKIVPFRCSANRIQNDNVMNAVAINFPKEEPLAYQFLHVQPGSNELFSLKVITNNGTNQSTQRIRTNKNQEMWLMCCKNPENPQLRDAYAIVWEHTDEIEGTIYMISSLRPDMYEKAAESRMFKIVGRVDENIKDSLYNIYIAESREALYNLEDHEYVACVPVVNKRFEWQTELTKPCVGRLRCIFPDGELCSAWIDLDFVPGETYNITVHNGYYDEDKDYERRVGRQSGHSLIEPNAVKVVESIRRENLPADATYIGSVKVEDSQPIKPTEVQRMQLKAIFELAEIKMEDIKALYQQLRSKNLSWVNKGAVFDNITKKNKELDKQFQDVIKVVKGLKMSKHEESQALSELYKKILEFYTEQNKILTEMSGQTQLPKSAQKTQETVSKIIQKYMNEMSKMLMQ